MNFLLKRLLYIELLSPFHLLLLKLLHPCWILFIILIFLSINIIFHFFLFLELLFFFLQFLLYWCKFILYKFLRRILKFGITFLIITIIWTIRCGNIFFILYFFWFRILLIKEFIVYISTSDSSYLCGLFGWYWKS